MSVHVEERKNPSNGRMEWIIRYPGWTREEAQRVADAINGGAVQDHAKAKAERLDRLWSQVNENPNPDLCA